MPKPEFEHESGIKAKVIADSTTGNDRLTTLQLKFHRFILPEFLTHRVFSRNASSSRATPTKKILEQVEHAPAMPISWGENKPGMQANKELNLVEWYSEYDADWNRTHPSEWWEEAASYMVGLAMGASGIKKKPHPWKPLGNNGLHKQVVNRVLEPFQFAEVIVTATEWENFFNLRLHEDAQPEIRELARCMKQAIDASTPNILEGNYWHVPYVEDGYISGAEDDYMDKIKCSVARCARVSPLNHDQTEPSVEKDIELYHKLLDAGHMSPFEHVATPFEEMDALDPPHCGVYSHGCTHTDRHMKRWSSNFRGWAQYRNLL